CLAGKGSNTRANKCDSTFRSLGENVEPQGDPWAPPASPGNVG
ncbi:unnamed protein product, partial [Ectocarpus sp. 8 AP-2014]